MAPSLPLVFACALAVVSGTVAAPPAPAAQALPTGGVTPIAPAANAPAKKAVALPLRAPGARAAALLSGAPKAGEPPLRVKVGLYVVNIGRFDLATGTHVAEFYLSFECPTGRVCPVDFDLLNGRALSRELVRESGNRKSYLVRAELADDLDFREFPFDRHDLAIDLVDRHLTQDQLIFETDKEHSGLDKAVRIAGWKVHGWRVESAPHEMHAIERSFSHFRFTMTIGRFELASMLKIFLPAFFIVLVASLACLLKGASLGGRLGIGTAGLIASVMFHLSSTSSLPPMGYLTRIDKLMFATYLLLLANVLVTILLLRATDRNDQVTAARVFKTGLYAIPPLVLGVYSLVLFRIV